MSPETNASTSSPRGGFRDYGSSILIAVGLALLIRSTVVQAFYIPSGSMEDTLFIGDYLLANKFIYGAPVELPVLSEPLFRLPALRDPEQGDIVIFRSKTEVGRDLIKRCVAVGGQTVEVRDKLLYVDGTHFELPPAGKLTDPRILPGTSSSRDNFGPYRVPEDSFFMMGDNRDNSNDSRMFGPVPRRLIKGKAMIIYWSSTLVSGPLNAYTGLPQLLLDAGNFLWNLPTLPFRSRYTRLGTIIH
ncbi:MAG: signal peptidase I [Candidatus Latescibacteria bacterium]|jgi:signal peptidase I|nr:signal peptidase I [Candidatus Latescibacterota bacterium]